MNPSLSKIDANEVVNHWKEIYPIIKPAIDMSYGRIDHESIYLKLSQGAWKLWGVTLGDKWLAFIAAGIIATDTGQKILDIKFMAGQDRKRWLPLVPYVEGWAIDNGCDQIQMLVPRRFAGDLPDYNWTHSFLERSLK